MQQVETATACWDCCNFSATSDRKRLRCTECCVSDKMGWAELGRADTSRVNKERAALRFCPMRKALYLAGLSARQGSTASLSQLAWWLPQDANHHTLRTARYEPSRREIAAARRPLHHGRLRVLGSPGPAAPGPSISNCGGDARCESSYLSAVLRAHLVPNAASCVLTTHLCYPCGFCFLCHRWCMCCLECGMLFSLFSTLSFKYLPSHHGARSNHAR
jgi:hypothetical protein